MEKLFGGNPVAVIIRLLILSVIVGIVLSALDITPRNFLERISLLANRIYQLGFGVFEWAAGYIVLGAIVVVPIWLIMRLTSLGRSDDQKSDPRA
ncbi:MAG: DUF6460 domain-containing protein [Pseudomonadota bacterium]